MRKVLYLNSERHVQHLMAFTHNAPESEERVRELPDGGVVLPEGATECEVQCIECGVTLIEGVDYEVDEFLGDPDADPDTLFDGRDDEDEWEREHRELYGDTDENF